MPIKPRELRQAAERIAVTATTEVDRRGAISRSYYAAYHRCCRWERQLPYPGAATPGGGMHAQLIARLHAPDQRCDDIVKTRSQDLAKLLEQSRERRVLADYELHETVGPDAVEQQLAATREVFARSAPGA